jgi:uncharacterized protein (DUF2147 family)
MRIVIFLLCFASGIKAVAQEADAIVGVYLIDEGDSKVEIYQSSNGISGKVVWLAKEERGHGPVLDDKNEISSLRTRRVMGLVVFEGLNYKNGKWSGNIYSPRKGRFYDATFALNQATGELSLRIKVAFLTFSRYWSRV